MALPGDRAHDSLGDRREGGRRHRRAYDKIAARMFWVDTPGPCTSQLRSLPFRRVTRPVYPLDPL